MPNVRPNCPPNGHPKLQPKRLAQALTLALATLAAPSTFAQSNTTSTLLVRAEARAQVLIENLATGLKRRLAVEADGRVQAGALPPGTYRVSLLRGEAVLRSTEVELLVGQGALADLNPQQFEQVVVTGVRKVIDVSNTDNGATFTAKQLDKPADRPQPQRHHSAGPQHRTGRPALPRRQLRRRRGLRERLLHQRLPGRQRLEAARRQRAALRCHRTGPGAHRGLRRRVRTLDRRGRQHHHQERQQRLGGRWPCGLGAEHPARHAARHPLPRDRQARGREHRRHDVPALQRPRGGPQDGRRVCRRPADREPALRIRCRRAGAHRAR
jgi:hypothetical protein